MIVSEDFSEVLEEIKLFTIENKNGTKLIVSNYGAAVVSLFVNDRHGNLSDIVLGYDDPADYTRDEFYMGTIVGRYANRISSDTVIIDGQPYKLSAREGGYHLHGGSVGFNKKIFAAEPFQKAGKSGISLRYTSPHLEEGFPGELELEVIYTLDNEDAWTVEYKAVSARTTLVNLTQHTYFNLSGNPASGIDEHELKIDSAHFLPVNELQVPTGDFMSVHNTPFDFRQLKKIAADINAEDEQLKLSGGYDHSFVLEKTYTPALKNAAEARDPLSGRVMKVYTTEPAVHFYTGNFLDNIKGKKGIIYKKRSGFCLETQHFPDAPHHPDFPSTVLKAGEPFYSKTIFKFYSVL